MFSIDDIKVGVSLGFSFIYFNRPHGLNIVATKTLGVLFLFRLRARTLRACNVPSIKLFWGTLYAAKDITLVGRRLYLITICLWPVEITWSSKLRLNYMNKCYSIYCWRVATMLNRAGDFWDKSPSPPKMKAVIMVVKICMIFVSCVRELNFEIIVRIIHEN